MNVEDGGHESRGKESKDEDLDLGFNVLFMLLLFSFLSLLFLFLSPYILLASFP